MIIHSELLSTILAVASFAALVATIETDKLWSTRLWWGQLTLIFLSIVLGAVMWWPFAPFWALLALMISLIVGIWNWQGARLIPRFK